MAERKRNTFEPPYSEAVVEKSGLASRAWQGFFRSIFERLLPLGIERSARIVGHLTDVYNIEGLVFDQMSENAAIVDYLIQRVSTDDPETGTEGSPDIEGEEEIEFGSLYIYYKPSVSTWVMDRVVYTGSSTATLSIDATTGQLKYQAQPLDGISVIEKITWRTRTFTAKFRGNY